ncbi:class D beta-lactamase [Panacibacter sp. DH6]|uniref:Beta-lactamase n=1 Tax=Panacibacter microcysteis TaxID=2793269 RepID=A0A931E6P4_9BACT|nr:class D beta-lactamase [Panacibacter microcysteis]MBG9376159.1 class D beta-lactamase [Panacibacter microcysteis]
MKLILPVFAIVVSLLSTSCSNNNVTVDDSLQTFFDQNKVNGTFGLFDNGQGSFTIYNLSRFKDSAYLPASTFKIVNSLIGIQTGRISNERMIIPWDGVVRTFPNGDTAVSWNKDLTMDEAFRQSAVPYYQEIARRIGKDTMQTWLDSLGYGSKDQKFSIGNNLDTFWLDNTLKITPDEQLGLVKKLYFKQLPFQSRAQEIVKKAMTQENNANYQLSYKTGWGFAENGNAVGWAAGWIEENQHPYFFVLNIDGPHSTNIATAQKNILAGILKQLGFFEGRK